MFKILCFLTLFASLLSIANTQTGDVIKIQSPLGIKSIVLKTSALQDPTDIILSYTGLPVSKSEEFPLFQQDLISEKKLKAMFADEAEKLIYKMISLTGEILKVKGIRLNKSVSVQVKYDIMPFDSYGWTTRGFVNDCWDCGSSSGIREKVARSHGLDSGSLYDRVSNNPRFVAQRLYRGSASIVQLMIDTVERGIIRVPFVIQIDDIYHPFVAEPPPLTGEGIGTRIYGTTQVVRVSGRLELDRDDANKKKLEELFPEMRVVISGVERLGIIQRTVDVTSSLPSIFQTVANTPVPGDRQAAQDFDKSQALADLGEFIELSDTHLGLPGQKGWFGQFLNYFK